MKINLSAIMINTIITVTVVLASSIMGENSESNAEENATQVAAADTVVDNAGTERESDFSQPEKTVLTSKRRIDAEPDIKTSMRTYFYWDMAHFNEVSDLRGNIRKAEQRTSLLGGIILRSSPVDNINLKFTPEFRTQTSFPMRPGDVTGDFPRTTSAAWLDVGKVDWAVGGLENHSWELSFGLQYYKYNPHTKVLGDYFIKSMIYPSVLFTRPFNSDSKILGLSVKKTTAMIDHNFIVHSNYNRYPHGDINLAYSATVNIGENFEIGAGLNWISAIPLRPSRTNPKGGEFFQVYDNTWKQLPFQDSTLVVRDTVTRTFWVKPVLNTDGSLYVDTLGHSYGDIIIWDETARNSQDTNRYILKDGELQGLKHGATRDFGGYRVNAFTENAGLVDEAGNFYPELGIVETPYSFSGQTISMRAAYNPMPGESDMGTDPFKVYAEAALLGIKNYNGFYEDQMERIPLMLGLYLPTMNFLDYLVAEVEWFDSPYEPSYGKRFFGKVPQPGSDGVGKYSVPWLDESRQKKDNLKWAIAAKRSFPGFALAAQTGTDHTRSTYDNERFHDLMSRPSQWYTSVRFIVRL